MNLQFKINHFDFVCLYKIRIKREDGDGTFQVLVYNKHNKREI